MRRAVSCERVTLCRRGRGEGRGEGLQSATGVCPFASAVGKGGLNIHQKEKKSNNEDNNRQTFLSS